MDAYRIAYDGRPYRGFQRQPDVPTVEDTLLSALRELGVLDGEGTPPGYAAAGRTDAGVSALAQTVAFEAPEWLSPAAFNSELPASVRAWARAAAPEGFHATHDADGREYTYFLHAPDVADDRVGAALDALAGEHDFHNLTPDDAGTVRDLSTAFERDGAFVVLRFSASGFPRQLVRRAVTVVDAVTRERRSLADLDRLLSAEVLSGPDGVAPASPHPLALTAVSYSDMEFTIDDRATERAREQFEELRVQRASLARVAGVLADGIDAGGEYTGRRNDW